MNKIFKLAILIVFLIFYSCSDEKLYDEQKSKSKDNLLFVEEMYDTSVSLEEALLNAENEFRGCYGIETRASKKIISNVELLTYDEKTRGSQSNVIGFYVVNYERGGFAILGNDLRLASVYAISDEGRLELSDTVYNKGINWYVNSVLREEVKYASLLPPEDFTNDSTLGSKPPVGLAPEIDVTWSKPLLPSNLTKFHQSAPYNKYCKTSLGEQSYVGCVAVAFGSVMGYYKCPDTYKNYNFDWTSMCDDNKHDSWSRLFEILGREENLCSEYYVDRSVADRGNFQKTWFNMGYEVPKLDSFDLKTIKNQLDKHNPVIVTGGYLGKNVGHVFIIDGGYEKILSNPAGNQQIANEYPKYVLHCIWGWTPNEDGYNNNGYFLYNGNILGHKPIKMDNGAPIGYTDYWVCQDILYDFK